MRKRSVFLAGVAWSVAWFGYSMARNEVVDASRLSTDASHSYDTAIVGGAEVVRTITATGALQAFVNVEVGSQLSGVIGQIYADFNDSVKKGQILAELDPRSVRAAYEAATAALSVAQAQVAVAEAKLRRACADAEQSQGLGAVMAARVDEAAISAESALRLARRKAALNGSGAGSAAEAQDAEARGRAALVAVREAQAALSSQQQAAQGGRADYERAQAELDLARAEVKRLEAQLQAAELDLERTRIRAPIDGVVIARNITVGQTLTSTLEAKTLFVVAADLTNMEVHARVDESDIAEVRPGLPAEFTVEGYRHRVFKATVRQVRKAPVLVQNVVTYIVVLSAPNDDLALLPGMTATARIETSHAVAELSVPLSALRFRPMVDAKARVKPSAEPSVWVMRDGAMAQVNVKLGAQDERSAAVTGGGLRRGDVVLTGERRAPGEG